MRLKTLLLGPLIGALLGYWAYQALAVTATKITDTDFRKVYSATITGDGNMDVTVPAGFENAGHSAECDGDDGTGTITFYFDMNNGTADTAVTDSLGDGVTCTAACVKTLYQGGFGAGPSNYRATLSGSAGSPTPVCLFIFTRPKS